MANDRIYLMCKGCAHHICLFKFYCSEDSSYVPIDKGKIEKFMNDHLFECQQKWGSDLNNDPGFVLVTEGDDYGVASQRYKKPIEEKVED